MRLAVFATITAADALIDCVSIRVNEGLTCSTRRNRLFEWIDRDTSAAVSGGSQLDWKLFKFNRFGGYFRSNCNPASHWPCSRRRVTSEIIARADGLIIDVTLPLGITHRGLRELAQILGLNIMAPEIHVISIAYKEMVVGDINDQFRQSRRNQ